MSTDKAMEAAAEALWNQQGYLEDLESETDPFKRLTWDRLKEIEADYAPTVQHTYDLARAAISAYLKAVQEDEEVVRAAATAISLEVDGWGDAEQIERLRAEREWPKYVSHARAALAALETKP